MLIHALSIIKKIENDKAIQIFTKNGPLAFLPISNSKHLLFILLKEIKIFNLRNLIKKYNKLNIFNKKLIKFLNFKLKSSNLRNYV